MTTLTLLAGLWAGTVLNCYDMHCMPGFSWFQVDHHGRYRAWTLARKPGATCLSHDPNGWTGQLYPIGPQTLYAQNDGATTGYLIQLSANRQTASSTYLGPDLHTVESNTFYRTKPIPPSRLLAPFRHLRCPETTP